MNVNIMNWVLLVGKVGFEPTHPKGTDLQSAVTLQLHRLPILNGDATRARTVTFQRERLMC